MIGSEFNKCGIYCLHDSITNKDYVGQSVNIQKRYYSHVAESKDTNRINYNYPISVALREHKDNIILSILEECDKEHLDEKEIFWINKLNSLIPNGYNIALGGNTGPSHPGESNPRAKLTEQDVIYIRNKLLEGYNFRDVYPEFKDRISKRGLQHIWWGTSWTYIMPEIYEDRDYLFRNHKKGKKEFKRIISLEEYKKILDAKNNGEDRLDFYNKYYKDKVTISTFNRYWYEYMEK